MFLVPAFVPKPDHELERLDDDALIAYIRHGRAAGDGAAAARALAIVVFGHWRNVERRVAMKVPREHVEDVTSAIVVSAISSAFDGTSVGEFLGWLATITRRRIADFHRRRGPETVPLAAGSNTEARVGTEPEAPSEEGYVEVQDAIERVLARLSAKHRRAVELRIFAQRPSAEVAASLPGMSVDNVDQIASRFRRALRRELRDDGDTPG